MPQILKAAVTAAFMDRVHGPGEWVYCTIHKHGAVWHHKDYDHPERWTLGRRP